MKITRGCLVELQYELYDGEGLIVETNGEGHALTYLHGNDEIPDALEARLEGAEEGAELEVKLGPGEAYGPYNPDGLVSVPRSDFPPDAEIVPGDWVSVSLVGEEGEESPGEEIEMRVVEISPEGIVLDANHPLAGQEVTFDLIVVSVRLASPAEIAERASAGTDDGE